MLRICAYFDYVWSVWIAWVRVLNINKKRIYAENGIVANVSVFVLLSSSNTKRREIIITNAHNVISG